MRKLAYLILILLVLLLSSDVIQAEDQEQDQVEEGNEQGNENGEGADGADENQEDENEVNEGEEYAEAEEEREAEAAVENDDDSQYVSKVQICSDAIIQVQDVSAYCDSPGTYYYGSGKYRNNQYCKPGDKLKVQINFYIADHDTIQQAGNYALVDIYADGANSIGSKTVYEDADLCSLSSLKKKSGNQCPYNGYYQISTQFYWDASSSNSQEVFEPVVHVGFKSNLNVNTFDYGGANTNCRGSSFVTFNDNIKVSFADGVANLMKTFGILLSTILAMSIFVFLLAKRPTSFADAKRKLVGLRRGTQSHRTLSMSVDEGFDFRKIQAANRDLVDF